ncbi:MAG: DUF3090 family protein [Actinomycetota bacterium]
MIEFDPADRLTTGAIGEPGQRIFYVQADRGIDRVTLLAEKEQVAILGQALLQLIDTLPEGPEGAEPSDAELELEEPLEPEWRAGEISINYDEENDRVAILITEMRPGDDDEGEPEEPLDEPEAARFTVSRAQARAMAARALDVVAAGRPRCQFCGNPVEADGEHTCPAMNGHRKFGGDE